MHKTMLTCTYFLQQYANLQYPCLRGFSKMKASKVNRNEKQKEKKIG